MPNSYLESPLRDKVFKWGNLNFTPRTTNISTKWSKLESSPGMNALMLVVKLAACSNFRFLQQFSNKCWYRLAGWP